MACSSPRTSSENASHAPPSSSVRTTSLGVRVSTRLLSENCITIVDAEVVEPGSHGSHPAGATYVSSYDDHVIDLLTVGAWGQLIVATSERKKASAVWRYKGRLLDEASFANHLVVLAAPPTALPARWAAARSYDLGAISVTLNGRVVASLPVTRGEPFEKALRRHAQLLGRC